ncbi:MAG TPA: DUF4142 domain-containing protein [Fimbriimonas sp.]|nr:DUF4142 domain-containing protein [Fimbriimonas sp.]
MKATVFVTLACVAMGASASAQEVGFYNDGRPERIFRPVSGLSQMDIKFLKQAATIDKFEIEMAKIAQSNGGSPFVTEFAKEMIQDHQPAWNEAAQVAQNKGVDITGDLPKDLQSKLNHLRNLKGDEFDMQYRAINKAGHENAIKLYKKEVRNGRDEDVKGMAVKELPTVNMHYKMLLSGKTMMGSTASDHGQ